MDLEEKHMIAGFFAIILLMLISFTPLIFIVNNQNFEVYKRIIQTLFLICIFGTVIWAGFYRLVLCEE